MGTILEKEMELKVKKYKILYVTTLFDVKNSSASIRNNSLVKGLRELEHVVDVLTVEWPSELQSKYFLEEENYDEIERTRIKEISLNATLKGKFSSQGVNFAKLKQFAKKILFFPDVCKNWAKQIDYKNLENKYDFIISSSDMKSSHFVAEMLMKKRNTAKWVQIWGDPWETDINTPSFLKYRAKLREKKLLNSANFIFYVSSPTLTQMTKKYKELSYKMSYLPRGYYREVRGFVKKSEVNHIVYTGALSSSRNLLFLASIVDEYNSQDNGNCQLLIDVYGTYDFEAQQKLLKFDCVKLHSSLEYDEIMSVYSAADALIYLSNGVSSTQIPGKLYDYFGTSRPVICLVDNFEDEISTFLRSFDRCLVLSNTKLALRNKIGEIIKMMGQNFEPEQQFSSKSVARQFIDVIHQNKQII